MAGAAALVACAAWRRIVRRVVVDGASMMPTLIPGDRLVVVRFGGSRRGDLVALRDPDQRGRLLVKRVTEIGPDGLEVRGDNEAASRDSRSFGTVPRSDVLGRAVYRYFPPARVGRLRRPASSSGTLDVNGPAPKGHRPVAGA
jgi:nickel-type superoxide dismutase maturation protease